MSWETKVKNWIDKLVDLELDLIRRWDENRVIKWLFSPILLDKLRITRAKDGEVIKINNRYYLAIESERLCTLMNWNGGSYIDCHVARDMNVKVGVLSSYKEGCRYKSECLNVRLRYKDGRESVAYLNIEDLVICEYELGMSMFKCQLIKKEYGRYL